MPLHIATFERIDYIFKKLQGLCLSHHLLQLCVQSGRNLLLCGTIRHGRKSRCTQPLCRSSLPNQRIVRQGQRETQGRSDVVHRLLPSLEEDDHPRFSHLPYGIGREQNDLSLCDLGDRGDVARYLRDLELRVLDLRYEQVETKT